ncbi:MAG: tRNA (adenosine(37)-N6)-threonylcarbamoyltransferase complex dimerization subunit type 1 TsaB [Alphaproteobacteria bacterium]
MKILGLDTALGACSVALLDGDRVAGHAHEKMQRGHAEALAPMTETVMRESGISFSDLERLAVTTGPGTFTGQRVGLAFARAMALALKIPAIGVTTLEAMAAQALSEGNSDWALAISDARRGEVYLGARSASGETLIEASIMTQAVAVELVAQALSSYGRNLVLAGTGAEHLQLMLESKDCKFRPAIVQQPDAIFVAQLGAVLATSEGPPKPLYLRAPDAKLPSRPRL